VGVRPCSNGLSDAVKELNCLDHQEDCICCWDDAAVAEQKECVSYTGRFEGIFPVRATKGEEGTGLSRSVCSVLEKNGWR